MYSSGANYTEKFCMLQQKKSISFYADWWELSFAMNVICIVLYYQIALVRSERRNYFGVKIKLQESETSFRRVQQHLEKLQNSNFITHTSSLKSEFI